MSVEIRLLISTKIMVIRQWLIFYKNLSLKSEIIQKFPPARPEPVEGYPRALGETLQQVQGERNKKFSIFRIQG